MKVCFKCDKQKPETEFRKKKRSGDGLDTRCKTCMKEYDKNLYQASPSRKADIRRNSKRFVSTLFALRDEAYAGKSCMDCGNQDHRVFEFDHVRGKKEFSISNALRQGRSRESIILEIGKCDLVCANCHRVRTYERRHAAEV